MPRNKGDYREWRNCRNKARFADEHEANRRAALYGLRAYGCEYCAGFHLTHTTLHEPVISKRPSKDPPSSSIEAATRKLNEAETILSQLERKPNLPPKLLEKAREAVEEARKVRDALLQRVKAP